MQSLKHAMTAAGALSTWMKMSGDERPASGRAPASELTMHSSIDTDIDKYPDTLLADQPISDSNLTPAEFTLGY